MIPTVSIDDWITDYGEMVYSLCLKVIRNRELALDTSQSVWEIVLRKKGSFRNESRPGTWIYTIAYREALRASQQERSRRYTDTLRGYHEVSSQPRMEDELADNAQIYGWLSGTCNMCLSGIIGTLNFKTRIIVVFRYILDISFEEISRILGMEQAAVRKAASRGKKRLTDFFENECGLYAKNAHCKCGLERYLEKTSFKNDLVAMKSITAKAFHLHNAGSPLPPIEYWEKIRASCHR
jgi:RNA polymerase sigma-70 factor (ECF subfamily)